MRKTQQNKLCSKSLSTIKNSNESPKYQKTSFKKNDNKQISRKEGANGLKNDSVKQTQMSRKQDGHKDWKTIFPLCRNRAIKILRQKSCVSKINDACNRRKTRLALLITRESSEQDAPCQTGNCY